MTDQNLNDETKGGREDEFAHILTSFPLVADPIKVAARNAYRDVAKGLLK